MTKSSADKTQDKLETLLEQLILLPGIGRRSAERIAFSLLAAPVGRALSLADAIRSFRTSMRPCAICCNLTDSETCVVCSTPGRDASRIMIVENPADARAFETANAWDGVYHILMGRVSPQTGIELEDLTVDRLLARLQTGGATEIVLATSATQEGDVTVTILEEKIRALTLQSPPKVSRIARGLPVGGEISFAQSGTLARAITDRQSRG